MMRYRAIPEYYDAEYDHQDMLSEDVPFFLEHTRGRQSVLELAAGTARCAIPIAQAGHRVVGVDYDERMLEIGRRKCEFAGLTPRQVELLHGDMLHLNLGRRFDWVCIFFNTFLVFTTLEQQDQALQMIRKHLKPRGRLWIDVFQPNLLILARPRSIGLEPRLFHVPQFDRTVYKTTEIRPQPAKQLQRVIFHYTWFDAHGQPHRQQTPFDLTFIFPRELHMLMERNGLRIERLYGNYDGSPLDDNSPRMIANCRLM